MSTHFQLIPCCSRAQGERGYHGNSCPAQGFWPAFLVSVSKGVRQSHPLQYSPAASLRPCKRTDWTTLVPHSSSHFLVFSHSFSFFSLDERVKDSQCGVPQIPTPHPTPPHPVSLLFMVGALIIQEATRILVAERSKVVTDVRCYGGMCGMCWF